MKVFIHQNDNWPNFTWNVEGIVNLLSEARNLQGRLMGKMESLGFDLKNEALLDTLTLDVIKSSEIEGEVLNPDQVRSSIARRLGMEIAGSVDSDRNVDGVVETMLDATQNCFEPLTAIKAAIAHLWFVTIHPFEDGNGRITRALSDMILARSDKSNQRFYSMSAQIRQERKGYYAILEKTQKGNLDITKWIVWFLQCLINALRSTESILKQVMFKADFWNKHSKVIINERQSFLINKLLDGFDGKLTSSKWAKIAKCSKDTAIRDINDLINKNILRKEAAGGRSTNYELKR
jgi:Fic family protein